MFEKKPTYGRCQNCIVNHCEIDDGSFTTPEDALLACEAVKHAYVNAYVKGSMDMAQGLVDGSVEVFAVSSEEDF